MLSPSHIAQLITLLGDRLVIIAITGLIGIPLLFSPRYRAYATGLFAAVFGAALSTYVVKMVVGRVRPDGFVPTSLDSTSSFPSWHAAGSVALYGFLAFLLMRRYPQKKGLIIFLASLVILAIGVTRLYLDVHFLSDVVAGCLLGGFWLFLGIEFADRLHSHITRHA